MGFALLSEKWTIVLLSKDIEMNHDHLYSKSKLEQRLQKMKD
jgi:hypothetical protein